MRACGSSIAWRWLVPRFGLRMASLGTRGTPLRFVCVHTRTVIRALCCMVSGSICTRRAPVSPPLCHCQGPACAIVCAAATLYRNYFVNGGRGQRKPYQLNLLADVEGIVGNDRHKYWTVKNGYCLPVRARETRTRPVSPFRVPFPPLLHFFSS